MRLIHITDPHLTNPGNRPPGLRGGKRWLSWLSWQVRRRKRHRRDRLDALTGALAAEKPDVWAVTGDLCQTGLESEVMEARRWLDGLAPADRALLVPGNHDVFADDSAGPIARHWADYLHVDAAAAEWPVVRRYGEVALIGVNSAVVTPVLRAGGRLGRAMRDRLEQRLAQHAGACRVVLMHHPALPGVCKTRKALDDVEELSAVLGRHAPALVLHGHLHRDREWRMEGKREAGSRVFCTASASAAGAQGAPSARVFDIERVENRYVIEMRLVRLDGGGGTRVAARERWTSPG